MDSHAVLNIRLLVSFFLHALHGHQKASVGMYNSGCDINKFYFLVFHSYFILQHTLLFLYLFNIR